MRGRWIASITTLSTDVAGNPAIRIAALSAFYLVVFGALLVLYGRGDFSTPSFVYQEF